MSSCKVDKKTLAAKVTTSDWIDLSGFPTDKTLYLHPSKLGSTATGAGGTTVFQSQVAIEVSPDKETVVRLPVSFANTGDHHYPTSFDYQFARVVRLPNGPGAGDSSDVAWTLTACAADEQETSSARPETEKQTAAYAAVIEALRSRLEEVAAGVAELSRRA